MMEANASSSTPLGADAQAGPVRCVGTGGDGTWVFAYGSLMWRPDFPYVAARPARLWGYHRSLCVLSTIYRGTPERPGLVLGLDCGGSCLGRAFLVPAAEAEAVRQTLHEREMRTGVYRPGFLRARFDDGARAAVYAFVVDRGHYQYRRFGSDLAAAAALIRQGHGMAGSSRDYLASTVAHLDALGIGENTLRRLLRVVDGG